MVRKNLLILSAIMIIACLSLSSAITGKIGNARVVLYPKVGLFGTTIDRTILVINDINENELPINVKLEAGNNSEFIKIIDKEFTLQPGEEKSARFQIKLKTAGDYEGRVNVYFSPADGNGAGVVLSSTIILYASEGSDSNSDSENDTGNSDSGDDKINLGETLSNKDYRGIIIATISTILLAVLLIILLIFKRKKDMKIKTGKRSGRSG